MARRQEVRRYALVTSGEYCMDKKHGHGVYTWADGRRYDGMWENGKQHGEGVYYDAAGKARKGIWVNGKRTKWLDSDEEDNHQIKSTTNF